MAIACTAGTLYAAVQTVVRHLFLPRDAMLAWYGPMLWSCVCQSVCDKPVHIVSKRLKGTRAGFIRHCVITKENSVYPKIMVGLLPSWNVVSNSELRRSFDRRNCCDDHRLQFITLSVHLCLQHDGRDAARRAASSATADNNCTTADVFAIF